MNNFIYQTTNRSSLYSYELYGTCNIRGTFPKYFNPTFLELHILEV